ncbi:hypothetical protein FRX31_031824 [Thalictrum thalictroides]|uniref:Uncharacterized protein n=1 Tax=Thalictrum thalictroides TaxID=46969 RepID=A0A7J6V1K5_THATH|nr:hypothetical protein FRX31_031824 [Thalictrum thalictroides]
MHGEDSTRWPQVLENGWHYRVKEELPSGTIPMDYYNIVVGNPRNMRLGLRVLVVDNDPSTLLTVERMLTTKQYHGK